MKEAMKGCPEVTGAQPTRKQRERLKSDLVVGITQGVGHFRQCLGTFRAHHFCPVFLEPLYDDPRCTSCLIIRGRSPKEMSGILPLQAPKTLKIP